MKILEDVHGHTSDTVFNIMFTDRRILVLCILSPLDGRGEQRLDIGSLLFGSGVSMRIESIRRTNLAEKKRNKFKSMSPEELVENAEGCIEIPYSEIEYITHSKGFLGRSIQISTKVKGAPMIVKFCPDSNQFEEMLHILRDQAPIKLTD